MSIDQGLTLGQVIRKKRKQLGMSLRDLAAKADVHHATIDRIENDQIKVVDPAILNGIGEALRIDPLFLLSLNGSGIKDEDIRIIARAANKMTDKQRQLMMSILRMTFADAFSTSESDDLDDSGDGYLDERI